MEFGASNFSGKNFAICYHILGYIHWDIFVNCQYILHIPSISQGLPEIAGIVRSSVLCPGPVGFGHRAGLGSQHHHQGIPKANGSWGPGVGLASAVCRKHMWLGGSILSSEHEADRGNSNFN